MKIHPKFKLNGIGYSEEELFEVGHSLIREGTDYKKHTGEFLLDWLNPAPSIDVFTSGSTGVPKKIQLQKQHMVNSARATASFFGLRENSSVLLCLPANYISGKMMLVRAMVMGWQLDCTEPNSSPLEKGDKTYDFAAMVPLQVEHSMEKIDTIAKLIVGGAAVSGTLDSKLKNKQVEVYETYGMTETTSHIAARRIGVDKENNFQLLPNVEIAQDERGCLIIEAPKVSDDKVVTNDLVALVSENQFKWLGRVDNIINSGGVKLIPEQIEKKLSAVLANRFFVVGFPDNTLGQKLVLVHEGNADHDVLINTVKKGNILSKFEIPKEIVQVDRFCETENGKISRSETLKMIREA